LEPTKDWSRPGLLVVAAFFPAVLIVEVTLMAIAAPTIAAIGSLTITVS